MNNMICRVPVEMRDTDGVRLDHMLAEAGATVIREMPRRTTGEGAWVDLLLEHTSAPEDMRGRTVVPRYDEIDGELVFDRWEEWAPQTPEQE